METPTITIELGVKCKACGRKGATECGYCLRCVSKHLERRLKQRSRKQPARRDAEESGNMICDACGGECDRDEITLCPGGCCVFCLDCADETGCTRSAASKSLAP